MVPQIQPASDRAICVRADNPGPMTLEGTNTWVLREPGRRGVVVLDPGPLDETHLARVVDVARRDGGEIRLVLYSHHHPDHTESIDRFAEMTGAPARAWDQKWCRNAAPVADRENIEIDGLRLQVLATPGHTVDSVCLLLHDDAALLTADTVLGRGTTVVAYPDGALGPYLESLQLLRTLAGDGVITRLLPGHGPVVDRPVEVLDAYLAHRAQRLDQVRAAVAAGARTAEDVVARVYADVDRELWGAAEMSVRAQLDYLGV